MYKLLNKIRKIFFLYPKKEHDLVSKEEVRQKTHDMLKERNKEKKMKKRWKKDSEFSNHNTKNLEENTNLYFSF